MSSRNEQPDSARESDDRDAPKHPNGGELPIGAPVRVSRLDTLVHVRAEVSRLYREARKRAGRYPDPTTALKLAQILAQCRTAIELSELEARLSVLEDNHD